MKWGLLHRNVASLITPPQVKKTVIRPLTPEQAAVLLSTIEGERLEALFAVALSLGLRRGEVLGLCWQDVDFDSKTLYVNVALQDIEGELVLTDLKTASSKRSLPIPETLLLKLKAHRSRQLEEKLKRGSLWQNNELVFVTKIGTPISPRNLLRKFHSVLAKAKLDRISFHTLRHSCASLLLAQGGDANGHGYFGTLANFSDDEYLCPHHAGNTTGSTRFNGRNLEESELMLAGCCQRCCQTPENKKGYQDW
jgi:integrase